MKAVGCYCAWAETLHSRDAASSFEIRTFRWQSLSSHGTFFLTLFQFKFKYVIWQKNGHLTVLGDDAKFFVLISKDAQSSGNLKVISMKDILLSFRWDFDLDTKFLFFYFFFIYNFLSRTVVGDLKVLRNDRGTKSWFGLGLTLIFFICNFQEIWTIGRWEIDRDLSDIYFQSIQIQNSNIFDNKAVAFYLFS